MTTIDVFGDSIATGACRSCGASIVWVEYVVTGKRHPYNPPIEVRPTTRVDGTRTIAEIDAVSHFATCPQASQWRNKRKS